MDRFRKCLEYVLRMEGGYSDNPLDRGGATNRGITQETFDEWRNGGGLPCSPVSGISGQEVDEIYRIRYWLAVGANVLPRPLDLCLFDAAVQHGAGRAVGWLQTLVLSPKDGRFGPRTREAVSWAVGKHGVGWVVDQYVERRKKFYADIIARDPSQKVFEKGWKRRVDELVKVMKGTDDAAI